MSNLILASGRLDPVRGKDRYQAITSFTMSTDIAERYRKLFALIVTTAGPGTNSGRAIVEPEQIEGGHAYLFILEKLECSFPDSVKLIPFWSIKFNSAEEFPHIVLT